ncbi:HEPN domain-containing protein [Spirosoma aureum]|uniref:HEPN domain-containing protein n=1 Tax=Spirosoma aureum TaxID=2692134 RepID=A0A6G9AGW9_9BACT|nr:HEPN domain-containing protein [Spirosoma aureum]
MRKTKDEILTFRLSKSDKDLKAAKTLMASNDWDVAVNRLYYAAFHAVSECYKSRSAFWRESNAGVTLR